MCCRPKHCDGIDRIRSRKALSDSMVRLIGLWCCEFAAINSITCANVRRKSYDFARILKK
jgi:hypothetical protein